MAELPKSWGLRTVARPDKKLDIIGKDDAGEDYRVRTTDEDHITQRDIDELHAADRETYANRESGAREFCNQLCPKEDKSVPVLDRAMQFDDPEWIEAAMPIAKAGLGTISFGSTHNYRNGVERWLRTLKETQ